MTPDQQPLSRWAGSLLVAAALVMFAGVAIGFVAPSLRDAPPFVTDDVAQVAAAIAGNPTAWAWANGLILSAAIITALGLVPISSAFAANSRPWAWTGLAAFSLGTTFEVVDRLVAIGVTTWAAQRFPDPTVLTVHEAFDRFDDGLGTTFAILAFVAIGLYGHAIRKEGAATGFGSALILGAGVGVVLEIIGVGIPAFVYFGTAALGIAVWRIRATPARTPSGPI